MSDTAVKAGGGEVGERWAAACGEGVRVQMLISHRERPYNCYVCDKGPTRENLNKNKQQVTQSQRKKSE